MTFEAFFAADRRRLLRLCYLLLLDREAAADVCQEVLAEVWHRWDDLDTDRSPYAWAATVAINRCRRRHRRRALELRRLPLLAGPAAIEAPLTEDLVDVRRALGDLSDRQREAVVLHYWGGLTMAECATAMGITSGAIKRHLDRARTRLRTALGERPDPPESDEEAHLDHR